MAGIASELATDDGQSESQVAAMIGTFVNESRVTLELVIGQIDRGQRILEVGAGLCICSLFLRRQGFDITALEPALGGFGLFEQIKAKMLAHYADIDLPVLEKPAGLLDAATDSRFSLIYSNNVIEHIPDWRGALDAMGRVLARDGMMVHACPNYSVPYEPHYGVPVFRCCPDLSRKLFLPVSADPEIWESLNFLTCNQLKSYCSSSALTYRFRTGLLYSAIKRIDDDPLFRERHRGLVSMIATLIMRSGLGALIRRMPATLSTPMIIEIGRLEVQ